MTFFVIAALLAGCGAGKKAAPGQGQGQTESASRLVFTLGTIAQLQIHGPDAEAALDAVVAELERLTAALDRFNPQSDISRVNRSAGQWVSVDTETVEVIQKALELAELSGGTFDPTVAPLADLWGFVEDPTAEPGPGSSPTLMRGQKPPADEAIRKTLAAVGYAFVEVDAAGGRVRLTKEGAALDLGGIAKGYAADRAAELLRERGIESALINLGGDMYALGKKPNGAEWRIAVQHPRLLGDNYIAIISLSDRAVVTSGDYERYFEYEGVRYTHLIDPRTGYPQQGVASVTIVAPSGTQADALATAVAVMGMDEGFAFLESLPGVEGILISTDLEVRITSGLQGKVELRGVDF